MVCAVVDDVEKIGLIRGRLRLGAVSSSESWRDALRRFPNGEFLRPDMGVELLQRGVVEPSVDAGAGEQFVSLLAVE